MLAKGLARRCGSYLGAINGTPTRLRARWPTRPQARRDPIYRVQGTSRSDVPAPFGCSHVLCQSALVAPMVSAVAA